MDQDTRSQAQEIVRRLCIGRSICGVHFYADQPILVLASYDGASTKDFEGPAEAYLHIEAGWTVPDDLSHELAKADLSAPQRPLEDLVALAVALRKFPIVDAQMGRRAPHLGLQFANGHLMVINGWDSQYETWSIAAGDWSLYALANGAITWQVRHPAFV